MLVKRISIGFIPNFYQDKPKQHATQMREVRHIVGWIISKSLI
jgi:hypothetical protein